MPVIRAILLFAGVELLLAFNRPLMAKHLTPQEKVDSTFRINFHFIEESLNQQQKSNNSENSFAYVVDLLSGQDFFPPTDWSGVPQLTTKGLVAAKKWYHANRGRIKWAKLQRGLVLLDAPLTDETSAELDALRIR